MLATFLLTILGTFMTRSGVFNSVHSFTQSAIGPTILVFLAAALIFSVGCSPCASTASRRRDRWRGRASRDAMFLVNNLLFVLFTFTVLIGTVFPLIVEALRGVADERGPPLLRPHGGADRRGAAVPDGRGAGAALGPRHAASSCGARCCRPCGAAPGLAAASLRLGVRNPWTLLTLVFAGYTAHVTLRELVLPLRAAAHAARRRGAGRAPSLEAQLRRGRRRFGAYVVARRGRRS